MGPGGRLFTFEFSEKHAEVARANFAKAGFAASVVMHVGEALNELRRIEPDGPFDLVFIDADKANYENYFHWAAKNLRVGGLLIGDNCFAFGQIARTSFATKKEADIVGALNAFNVAVARHPDFRATMLPTGEGLCLAVKIR
jgi:caffeoyl-CoA O-methyltransferase